MRISYKISHKNDSKLIYDSDLHNITRKHRLYEISIRNHRYLTFD